MAGRDGVWLILVGVICAMFAVMFLSGALTWLSGTRLVTPLVAVGAFLVAVGLGLRRIRSTDGESTNHSVWDAIPSWQYGGRHAESGGLTRNEQERAIREVQEQASETERQS